MKLKRKKTWIPIARHTMQGAYGILIITSLIGRGYYIALAFLVLSALTGAWFCGWLCPFGTVQEWLRKLGRRLGIKGIRLPEGVERYLKYLRYVLLAASFTGLGFVLFLDSPYQTFLGAVTLNTAYISIGAWALLALFLALSLFLERPFCRYVCGEGARYGALSILRLFSLRRNPESCIGCGACDRACPTAVKISDKNHIRDPQCMSCLQCISACPVPGTLGYGLALPRKKRSIEHEKVL